MPRISIEAGLGNLTWALSNLGLADMFKPGYSQLYDISDYKWLAVSDVVHKTVLDIKEPLYTGAFDVSSNLDAAPTGASPIKHMMYNQNQMMNQKITGNYGSGNEEISIAFDKPFIYFVFDNVAGLVLVMGKAGQEKASAHGTYRLPL